MDTLKNDFSQEQTVASLFKAEKQSIEEHLHQVAAELERTQKELAICKEELAQTQNDIDGLMQSIQAGFIFLNETLHITRFNPMAADLLNLLPTDQGRPFAYCVKHSAYTYLINEIKEVLHSQTCKQRDIKIGSNLWYTVRVEPGQRLTDTYKGIMIQFTNITQPKKDRQRLRQLQMAIERSTSMVIILDNKGNVEYVNPKFTQVTGYRAPEVIGKNVFTLKSCCISSEEYQRLWQTVTSGKAWHGDSHNEKKNGQLYWESTTIFPFKNEKGVITHFIAIQDVVTEHKQMVETLARAKEDAEAANRAKSEFLANMSHEIRTPLNGILGFAQILKRDKALNPQQQDAIHTIQQSGEHLLVLINDILDLSKIEARKMELHPKNFLLPAFLKGIVQIIQIRSELKGIQFHYDEQSCLPTTVKGDDTRLRQVLINLLGNAVKFTEQGTVTFSVNHHQGKIQFVVEDTGQGIAPEHLESIFLPFQQAGKRHYRSEGTGLGLAISKKFVEMMGGTLSVKSTLGQGSTFWFDLTLPEVEENHSVHHPIEQRIRGFKGKPRKILIVDDEVVTRAILVNLLTPLGFDVRQAVDGEQALEEALGYKPDAIFMDLVMPVVDGFEATRKMRQYTELKNIIIIAASASVFEHHRQESTTAGCNDFVAKPIKANDLLEKLQQHLQLEWIYESLNASETDEKPVLSDKMERPALGPPKEVAKTLYDLTIRGNVMGVLEQATQLEHDSQLAPFVTEVKRLADAFRLQELGQFIQSYLDGP